MNRLLTLALVAATLASATLVVTTLPMLPERIATSFAWGGAAQGFMTRDGYLAFMLVLGIGLPWLVLGACSLASTSGFAMRNASYWLAPERRGATVAALRGFGAATGIVVALGIAAAHLAVIDANARTPPSLDEPVFLVGVALFAMAIVALASMHALRFRQPSTRP